MIPIQKPQKILENVKSFLSYKQQYVKLYKDFIGMDENSNIVSKSVFLNAMATGKYLPLRMSAENSDTAMRKPGMYL